MLRNSFIEPYNPKSAKAKFIEREMALFQTDFKKILFSQRPMSTKAIIKLPKKNFPTFIDDIMCNNEINTLLYSSNAAKEIKFYLKQKNSLLLRNPENYKLKKKKKLSPLGEIMLNLKNHRILNSLKDRVKEFFIKRKEMFEDYKNKLDSFERIQPNLETKLKKLYFKPINEIRLEGYRRAYKNCLKKSKSDSNFELPNIKFNMEDVFSRLSHNVILDPKTLQEKENKENEEKEKKEKEQNDNNNFNNLKQTQIEFFNHMANKKFEKAMNKPNKRSYKRNMTIKYKINNKNNSIDDDSDFNNSKIDINSYNYYYNLINMPSFNLTKIVKCSGCKEFKMKITPQITKRCLSALSCGPRPRPPKRIFSSEKKDSEKEEEEEEKIDYK